MNANSEIRAYFEENQVPAYCAFWEWSCGYGSEAPSGVKGQCPLSEGQEQSRLKLTFCVKRHFNSLNRKYRFKTAPSDECGIITGPPNGPVLFCSLASAVCRRRPSSVDVVVVVCNAAGGRAGRRPRGRSGDRHCTAGQYAYVPLGRHLVIPL